MRREGVAGRGEGNAGADGNTSCSEDYSLAWAQDLR
jgi:hypothetical protein